MFQPLKTLGRFTIQRVLGRGGMGVVYLATDTKLGRPVALKLLDLYEIPDGEKKSRFLHEAQAAASIRHPNVATIYEVGEAPDETPYIAMEYCDGVTLSQLLRRGPLDGRKFVQIARQIAEGVAAAHRNGVIHRDIKSANIVLQDDDTIKILDFGLAKRFDAATSQSDTKYTSTGGSFFGTLPYISPEQAQGQPADRRSDLFSVGVVLYELATGNLPFDDENPLVVLEKIRDAEPAPFTPADPAFPLDAAAIVSRLLQKDPDDRYQTAEQLSADLASIEREQTPLTGSSHPPTLRFGRTVRRSIRSSVPLWAIITSVVAVCLVVAMFVIQRRSAAKAARAATTSPIRSLAVLPFKNVSGVQGDDFLSIGLADALVTRLQQNRNSFQVRPTSAVLGFQKRADVNPQKAAEELDVDGVLEGHFIAAGTTIRVNMQLTDGRTGYGVWAGSIDGNRADLIRLFDAVSNRTSSAITERLGVEKPVVTKSEAHTNNPEAFEHYLKARAYIGTLLPEQARDQIAHLQRAIELDPNFAAAYADLSLALVLRRIRGFSNDPADFVNAERYARQAVRIDTNLPLAHLALGRILVRDPLRFRESVRENLAALRLNPSETQALYTLAGYMVATGDQQKANCVENVMATVDPTSNDVRARGYFDVNSVNPEAALASAKVALSHRETALAGHDISGLAYLMLGNIDAAQHDADEATRLVPNHYAGKSLHAMIAAARGDRAGAERAIESFRADAESNHWAAVRVSLCYAKLGDRKLAVEWLKRAFTLGNHSWYYFVKHPWYDGFQNDPEFQRVIGTMKRDLDDVRDDVLGIYGLVCPEATPKS